MTVRYCGDVNSPPQALLLFFFAGFLAIALQVDHLTQLTVTRSYIKSPSTTVVLYISDCHYIL